MLLKEHDLFMMINRLMNVTYLKLSVFWNIIHGYKSIDLISKENVSEEVASLKMLANQAKIFSKKLYNVVFQFLYQYRFFYSYGFAFVVLGWQLSNSYGVYQLLYCRYPFKL